MPLNDIIPGTGRYVGSGATNADRTERYHMACLCRSHFKKVLKFWLEALEGTKTYKQNGQEYLKYNTQDQFEAAKNIAEFGYGKPIQQVFAGIQEQSKQILEVRWLPPRPDDNSKAVDLKPGE